MMDFWLLLFGSITLWVLISKVDDYIKYRRRLDRDKSVTQALEHLQAEIHSLQEMLADVLLELDAQRRLVIGQKQESLPDSDQEPALDAGKKDSTLQP